VYAPKLLIHPNVKVERERALPIKGQALAQIGDKVEADQEVLVTELKGDLLIVRLAERLGVSPDEAIEGVVVAEGQAIKEGDLLCQKSGLFGFFEEKVNAPATGMIEFISKESSHIGIRMKPERLAVKAYLPGVVAAIDSDRVVKIQSSVGVLQGVFGRGAEGLGTINLLSVENNQLIESEHLAPLGNDLSGLIIAGGAGISEDAFAMACERKVCGIVTAAITSDFVEKLLGGLSGKHEETHLPIIMITEGFGRLSLSQKAHDILTQNNGKTASISGKTQVRAGAIRPEVIFHEPNSSVPMISENSTDDLSIDDMVRVVRGKNFGKIARVVEIPRQMQVLDSGVHARCLILQFDGGSTEPVALANLESV
jgi:hypothetical protein